MRFKGTMRKSDYIVAITIGSLTGLVGFGLFLSLLLFSGERATELPASVETNNSSSEESIEVYALQYGAFSSREGAQQLINTNPFLTNAAIVNYQDKFYVWFSIELEPTQLTEQLSAYWKRIKLSNSCNEYPELLEHFKKMYESYQSQQNEFLAKLPAEWQEQFVKIVGVTSSEGVWRASILAHDIEKKRCLNLELD